MSLGKLILVTGPSGVGKRTLIEYVLKNMSDCIFGISATTRSPRPNEVHGKDYYFLTRREFQDRINRHGFLEHAVYADNYYGTPREETDAALALGKIVLLELEVQGARQIKAVMPEAVTIFITPPLPLLPTLRARLMARAQSTGEHTDIEKRLLIAAYELEQANFFEKIIVNDVLESAQQQLLHYIQSRSAVDLDKTLRIR